MIENKSVTAILLIAGNSTRFNKNRNEITNKNFELINGKPVIAYSLQAFSQNNYIDNIIIAAREQEFKALQNIIEKEKITKDIEVVVGGESRKESVYKCIKETNSDIVIIHDGARPLLKQEYINNCIENMKEFKGVTIAVKSKDTIKITNNDNIVIQTTNRANTWLIQTPQCFDKEILKQAHEKYKNTEVTDDCMLLEKEGYNIKIIEGDYTNLKITTYEDLDIAKTFI